MKKATVILCVAMAMLLSTYACKKKSTPTPAPMELLVSGGQKIWQIEKLFINDTLYNLTPEQLAYTKTYKSDSTFADSDGISGKYVLTKNGTELQETLISGGSGKLIYTVETLNNSSLVIRLINNGTSSLNNQFHFRAK
jgi:hypothetical protein